MQPEAHPEAEPQSASAAPPFAPLSEEDGGRFLVLVAVSVALLAQASFWGFVQDDAFISFRYARNLVLGHGLVFNPGERVEGYSNFLWTLLAAGPVALGRSPLLPLQVLGGACGVALVAAMPWLARVVRGAARPGWDALAALLLCGNTTLALWSASGLEESFFTLVGWAGFGLCVAGRPWAAAPCFAAALLTRPEGPLFLATAALWLALRRGAEPSEGAPSASFAAPAALLALLFAAYHGWRFAYFGDLLPNPYYVKGGGGLLNLRLGWDYVVALASFSGNGLLLLLCPLALLARDGRAAAGAALAFLVAYLGYEAKVGGDVLPQYRLHLAALPAQCLLAARAVEGLADGARALLGAADPARLLAAPLVLQLQETAAHPEFNGVRRSLERAHGGVGRYLRDAARPGDVIVGQDMGVMTWEAPDAYFLDAIGLCDRTVARELYRASYTPYLRHLLWPDAEARARIQAMEGRLREYVFGRSPRFFVVNVDVPSEQSAAAGRALAALDGAWFGPWVASNVFFHDLGAAPEWRRFRLAKGWSYSTQHFLLLYEREAEHGAP